MSAKAAEFIMGLPYVLSFTCVDGVQAPRPPAAAAVGLLMPFGHIATATLHTLPTRISVATINPIISRGVVGAYHARSSSPLYLA